MSGMTIDSIDIRIQSIRQLQKSFIGIHNYKHIRKMKNDIEAQKEH